MIGYILLWLIVGIIVMVLDQSVAPNEEGWIVFILAVAWPVLVAFYLIGGIYQLITKAGNRITHSGIRLKQRRLDKYIRASEKYNEEND